MIYPSLPAPVSAVAYTTSYDVLITSTGTNAEQRRLKQYRPKRAFDLQYASKDLAAIESFYHRAKGGFAGFLFRFPRIGSYAAEFVAKQTGTGTVFDLPCVSAENLKVYVNGVEAEVTIQQGAGTEGRDRIVFEAAPALGALITTDFTGFLTLNCRFEGEYSGSALPLSFSGSLRLVTV